MGRIGLTFVIAAVLTGIVEALPPRCAGNFDSPRVKAADPTHRALIRQGVERSPTFRQLITDIDASAWLVFVQAGRCPEKVTVACLLHFVGTFEGRLYLRIVARHQHRHPDNVISLLAHELQHAREVVHAAGVEDADDVRGVFERIGRVSVQRPAVVTYETEEAVRVEEAVWRELSLTSRRCAA